MRWTVVVRFHSDSEVRGRHGKTLPSASIGFASFDQQVDRAYSTSTGSSPPKTACISGHRMLDDPIDLVLRHITALVGQLDQDLVVDEPDHPITLADQSPQTQLGPIGGQALERRVPGTASSRPRRGSGPSAWRPCSRTGGCRASRPRDVAPAAAGSRGCDRAGSAGPTRHRNTRGCRAAPGVQGLAADDVPDPQGDVPGPRPLAIECRPELADRAPRLWASSDIPSSSR